MNPRSSGPVSLIGAGVVGLTTAIRLVEAGFRVTIVTSLVPSATTSAAAGAIWGPYEAGPVHRVRAWAFETLAELRCLASVDGAGVHMMPGIEASEAPSVRPGWSADLESFSEAPSAALPPGFANGWRFTVPVVDMPKHLAYLQERFTSAGGVIELRTVLTLASERREAALVVNCSGVAARQLVGDATVTPARGQLVIVENRGLDEFFVARRGDNPEQLYVIPHGDTVCLGGTYEPDSYDTKPDYAQAVSILERCIAVKPALADARIVGHRVGLRPIRPTVRLEASCEPGKALLIHNYGHGGAGVSLSWGCATEALKLALSM